MIRIGNTDGPWKIVITVITGALGYLANRVPVGVVGLSFFGGLGAIIAGSLVAVTMIGYRHIICIYISEHRKCLTVVATVGAISLVLVGWLYWSEVYRCTFEFGGKRYVAGKAFTSDVQSKVQGDVIVFEGADKEKIAVSASDYPRIVLEAAASEKDGFATVWPKEDVDRVTFGLIVRYLNFAACIGLLAGCVFELLLFDADGEPRAGRRSACSTGCRPGSPGSCR